MKISSGTTPPIGDANIIRPGRSEPTFERLEFTPAGRIKSTPTNAIAGCKVVIPGLVNAHAHSAMAALRGLGDGLALSPWLSTVMAAENTMTEEDMQWSLSLAMCEMIRSGTTAFADMFHWTEPLIETVINAGMRVSAAPAIFGPEITPFRHAKALRYPQQLDHVETLARVFAAEPLVTVMYGPHAIYTCGEEVFAEVARRAERSGLGIHVHLSETSYEVETAKLATGRTPIESASMSGLLGSRTLVAHAVRPSEADIELLARSGATVVHNPQSNLKLGSGIAPVRKMLDAGIPVALGTDGPASNDTLDLLVDLRLAVGLVRGTLEDPGAWGLADALASATTIGARGIGFEPAALNEGDPGDLVVLAAHGVHAAPMHSATAFVGWVASSRDITDVYVGGKALLLNGELQTLDEERIIFEVRKIAERLSMNKQP